MIANDGGASGFFSTANHWVVLKGGAGVTGGKAELRIWSWGKSIKWTFNQLDECLTNHYGYVSAMRARAA